MTPASVHRDADCVKVMRRRLYFEELLGRAGEKAAKEEKRRERAAEDFTMLLRATKSIVVDTTWDEASVLIASDRDYQAVRAAAEPLQRLRTTLISIQMMNRNGSTTGLIYPRHLIYTYPRNWGLCF